jgi:hypothetical protein
VRGDAALTARLLLRGAGLAGVTAAAGGLVLIVASLRAWSVTLAEISMLGGAEDRTVAVLRGVPATPGGWVALLAGTAAVVLGLAIALDRPPPHARTLVAAVGTLAAAAAVASLVVVPDPARIAGPDAAELLALRERLPVGVDLELRTAPSSGPWWALTGALLAVTGAGAARDR